jgi:DNA-binding PadR family transcriptional regulator
MTERDDDTRIARLLPLPTPTLYILVALRQGERHGYAIMQEIDALSDGVVRIGPGTMYGAIKRLLADGIVTEIGGDAGDDARRRYYQLTSLGQRLCDAELARLSTLVRRAGTPPERLALRQAR